MPQYYRFLGHAERAKSNMARDTRAHKTWHSALADIAPKVGDGDCGLPQKEKPLEGRQPFAAAYSIAVVLLSLFTGS
jgi:hypothetical protein